MGESGRNLKKRHLLRALALLFLAVITAIGFQNCGPQSSSGLNFGSVKPISVTPTPRKRVTPTPGYTPDYTPTSSPTATPTGSPTSSPTGSPTSSPTSSPTGSPTASPTASPTPTGGDPCANARAAGLPGMYPYDNPSGSHASHVPLYNNLKRAMQCDSSFTWYETSDFWGNHGTANYKMMFASAHYLWSTRFGTAAQKAKAKNKVVELLVRQERYSGHMVLGGNEQFCADPHANFWIASMDAITWGAWESNDTEVMELAFKWWAVHLYWLDQGWSGAAGVNNGETRLPATRVKVGDSGPDRGPSWWVDTLVYKIANGYNMSLGAGEVAGVSYFKKLYQRYPAAIPQKAQYLPGRLTMPIRVITPNVAPGAYRTKIIYMDRNGQNVTTEAVDWIKATGAQRGQFQFGRDWLTPVPQH